MLSTLVHRYLRSTVLIASILLLVLAWPASRAEVLGANDDDLALLVGLPLFGTMVLIGLVTKRPRPLLIGFASALLLQAWGLLLVEANPFLPLALRHGTTTLKLWTLIYLVSCATELLVAFAVVARRRAKREGEPLGDEMDQTSRSSLQ